MGFNFTGITIDKNFEKDSEEVLKFLGLPLTFEEEIDFQSGSGYKDGEYFDIFFSDIGTSIYTYEPIQMDPSQSKDCSVLSYMVSETSMAFFMSLDKNGERIREVIDHEGEISNNSDPFDCISSYNLGEVSTPGVYYGYFYNISYDCYSRASEPIDVIPSCMSNANLIVTSDFTIGVPQTFNKIEVKNGATLTISDNVEIKILDEIFVSNGSNLILDGGHITNCEICPKWNGVRLAGHLAIGFSTFNPGTLELKNGASISNATVGVDMRNSFAFPFINYTFQYGGGIVTMTDNSIISNCDQGIHFAPYGWGSVAGYGTPDEQSSIANSSISACEIGIYLEDNIGLEVTNSTFVDNYSDVEALSSSFDIGYSTLNSGIEYNAVYPSLVGGNIYNNNLVEADLVIISQGNIVPYTMNGNSYFGSGLFIFGDLEFTAANNDFYDSGIGIAAWESGDNQYNLVMNNAFYNNQYANSTYGANDIEYLTNCFENTDYYDIELYFNASIHESQGDPVKKESAGNCFDYYAKIGTGSGSEHFDYWTKDGYKPSANCKFPGQGNFTSQQADEELEVDNCGSGNIVTNLPPAYRDCECLFGDRECKETIIAIKNEIALLESNNTMNPWVKKWLIAKYKRCLDRLKKTYIRNLLGEGKKEDAISFTSSDTSFRYQIIAYAIMMNEMEYDRAHSYLSNLNQENAITYDFITAQNIYHSYLQDRNNYTLSREDRNTLFDISIGENPYSGYARSIYYLLTGDKVKIDLNHIDGNITYPRNDNGKDSNEISIFPNPLDGDNVEVNIKSYDSESDYSCDIISVEGRSIYNGTLTENNNTLPLTLPSGLYLIRIHKNGTLIKFEKLVKI